LYLLGKCSTTFWFSFISGSVIFDLVYCSANDSLFCPGQPWKVISSLPPTLLGLQTCSTMPCPQFLNLCSITAVKINLHMFIHTYTYTQNFEFGMPRVNSTQKNEKTCELVKLVCCFQEFWETKTYLSSVFKNRNIYLNMYILEYNVYI
jgi:hypothetical protein